MRSTFAPAVPHDRRRLARDWIDAPSPGELTAYPASAT